MGVGAGMESDRQDSSKLEDRWELEDSLAAEQGSVLLAAGKR